MTTRARLVEASCEPKTTRDRLLIDVADDAFPLPTDDEMWTTRDDARKLLALVEAVGAVEAHYATTKTVGNAARWDAEQHKLVQKLRAAYAALTTDPEVRDG